MYLADSHTHSILSMDGNVPLSHMAQAAVDAGFSSLSVTDHFDMLTEVGTRRLDYDWTPGLTQFQETAPLFAGKLDLRFGIELGEAFIAPDRARELIEQAGSTLDQVIGSIHNYREENGGGEYFFAKFTSPELCHTALNDYFTSMEELVSRPDCYDILGHIIYPLRYVHRDGQNVTLASYWDRLSAILRRVIDDGHSIEINTCRGNTVEDWRDILNLYRDLGGTLVTTGSDAHWPIDVGAGIRTSYELLKECGFDRITVYSRRTPELIKI